MTELFDAAKTFLSSLSTDQLVALFIGVMALSCAVKFLKDTLSTIVSILGVPVSYTHLTLPTTSRV